MHITERRRVWDICMGCLGKTLYMGIPWGFPPVFFMNMGLVSVLKSNSHGSRGHTRRLNHCVCAFYNVYLSSYLSQTLLPL